MRIRSDLPDIAIMVSRRIDINSMVINNPLYYPMRCGAVFDLNTSSTIPGDNTGNNISQKRNSFCELTVQYWAWKNVDAEYYGLCHYRRYLSFSDVKYKTNDHGLVARPLMNEHEFERFGLLGAEHMAEEIARYDMIIPQAADVSRMPLPRAKAKSVRELWEAHDGIFFDKSVIDLIFESVKALEPLYAQAAAEYFAGNLHCGYNCYIMRRSLFDRLCTFQFHILSWLEEELRNIHYPSGYERTLAYASEMLFGIFAYHVKHKEHWRICEKQLVFFDSTESVQSCSKKVKQITRFTIDCFVSASVKRLFPLGSKRRETGKKLYYYITRSMRHI